MIAAAVLLLGFAGLAWFVLQRPVLDADVQVELAIQQAVPQSLAVIMTSISWVGFPPESTVIDAVIVLLMVVRGLRWQAVCAAVAAAGSAGLWFLLVPLFHRPRPTADLVRVAADIPFGSFPSGHVLNLTAFFGFLGFLALTEARAGLFRTLAAVVCAVLLASIGFSRVYAGEHWPTDVLGGYLLGSAWLLMSISLYRWRGRPSRVQARRLRGRL